jgi:hypothetical protein
MCGDQVQAGSISSGSVAHTGRDGLARGDAAGQEALP